MVLESMINPKNAEDKPLHVFVISVFYTLVAVFFSYYLFPSQSSILSVAMVTIIFVTFFQKLFELEEEKEDRAASRGDKMNFFQRHGRSFYVYSAFFLGVVVAMSFVYIFFDSAQIFSLQADTVRALGTGSVVDPGYLNRIFMNNTQVLMLTFVLSILFGSGAILILAWNASVIAVYSGIVSNSVGNPAGAYVLGVPVALSSLALHGVPEILAYFIGGLAGGILSVGIIREKYGSKNFKMVAIDSVKLLFAAEALLVLAAFIEAV